MPRRLHIKAKDLDNFGFTDGCARCEHAKRYGHGETSKPHSETCRRRIMDRLMEIEEGQERLGRAGLRLDQYAAEEIQKQDRQGAAPAEGESAGAAGADGVQGNPLPQFPLAFVLFDADCIPGSSSVAPEIHSEAPEIDPPVLPRDDGGEPPAEPLPEMDCDVVNGTNVQHNTQHTHTQHIFGWASHRLNQAA